MLRPSTFAVPLVVAVAPLAAPAQTAGEVIRLFGDVVREMEQQSQPPPRYQPYEPSQPQGDTTNLPAYPPQPAAPDLRHSGPGAAAIREAQSGLNALGYDAGPADGITGRRTRAALVAFQRSRGLRPDGVPGPQTMAALREGAGAAGRVAAEPAGVAAGGVEGIYCHGSDQLVVSRIDGSRARYSLWSFQHKGHSCSSSGTAFRSPRGWRDPGDDVACTLDLVAASGGVSVEAQGADCPHLCGMQASLDAIRFPAGSRVASTAPASFDPVKDYCGS